jgi:hypothetical protein
MELLKTNMLSLQPAKPTSLRQALADRSALARCGTRSSLLDFPARDGADLTGSD